MIKISPSPFGRVIILVNFFSERCRAASEKFYLLIDAEAAKAAGVSEGAIVKVHVEPHAE